MMNNCLSFSLITPSLNQGRFIERAIQSVLSQNYPDLEYLVIDGGSNDGTLDILRRYEGRLYWLSEPDVGQSQAINKGFRMSTGEIIGWLNADDELVPDVLFIVSDFFSRHPEAHFVYGEALTIDEWGRSYGRRGNIKPAHSTKLATVGNFIVQPAAFWRVGLLTEVGYLDESLHYCLDYEYWLRVAQNYSLYYLPTILAKERIHTGAKSSYLNRQRLGELQSIAQRYGGGILPRNFQAEQAALYLFEVFCGGWANRDEVSVPPVSLALPVLLRAMPYLLALWLGPPVTVYLRLYHSLWRSKFYKVNE